MKKIFLTLSLLIFCAVVNTSLHAQVITTKESRCVNTGEVEITGTVGAGGPYQLSLVTYPAAYTPTGTQLANNLPDTFTALFPGSYVMKVIDRNGAVFNYPFSISSTYVLPGNNDYLPTATAVTNCAAPDGSIQGTLSNGRAPYTYTIVSGPAQVGTSNATGTFLNLPAGDYQLQAADSCENLQTRSVTIGSVSSGFTVSDPIINRVSCDSFVLTALTIIPSLPVGGYYQIQAYHPNGGASKFYTSTTLPIGFSTFRVDDIANGFVQIRVFDACGNSQKVQPEFIANDWDFTDADVTQTCAEGVVLHGVTTTGTIVAPYTTTITPLDPYGPPFSAPQTVSGYPYTVTGVGGATTLLKTEVTITDACGVTKTITKDLSFLFFHNSLSNFHFQGCDSISVALIASGTFTNPVTYSIYLTDFSTLVASNTTGTFTLPDGNYVYKATDACGKTGNTGGEELSHKWKMPLPWLSTFNGCEIGSIIHSIPIAARSTGKVTVYQYDGPQPVTGASTLLSSQIYSGTANNDPTAAIDFRSGDYLEFSTVANHTYSYVAIDSCGNSDTTTIINAPNNLGHQLMTHSSRVVNKCINKGDIIGTWVSDASQYNYAAFQIWNINNPDALLLNASDVNIGSKTLLTDLPLGTYVVRYSLTNCGTENAVFDTVVVAPYVQPKVLTAQSFPPCVGGGNPVIVRASDGVGPYMYEIINSTPSHFTAPPQSKSVFTLPSNQTTVTVRVIDACLNSTTRTVAITRAPAPFIWSNPAAFTACSLPFNYSLFIDSLYDGSVYEWTKITGTGAGSTVISDRPSLPLTFNSIADTATYQVRVTVPNTCFEQISQFSVPNVVLTCLPSISGNVFDDGNGLTDSTVNGTGTNATVLNAVLVNSSNQVVASVPVSADGTYNFINVAAGTYSVVLSTTAGIAGNAAPAASLPTGWLNTGENLGTGTGSDGAVNGTLPNIVVTNTDVTNANFGIEQIPVANNVTAPSQLNPGGTVQVTVPVLNGTDIEDGVYDGISQINTIIINTLPSTGILYYNGTAVTAGQSIPNYNPSLLTVDPNAGAVTVTFTYSEVDAAGVSSNPAVVTMSFTTLSLSGNVFNDANGLTDNTVNGIAVNGGDIDAIAAGTQQVYVNLLDNGGKVIASTAVAADGTYIFAGLNPGTYSVQVSTNQGTASQSAPATQLPANWVNTGENLGAASGNDGTVNGILPSIVLSTTDITNANFGIEQLPNSVIKTAAYAINTPGVQYAVPGLTGTDAEDGSYADGNTYIIKTLPANAVLYYNGVAVTAGQTISNFNTALLTIDPANATLVSSFTYASVDAAGNQDPSPASVTITWSGVLPITLLDFSANKSNTVVALKWTTGQEINSSYMEVQRSADGNSFSPIGSVATANTGTQHNYSLNDMKPLNGSNYYRLKLVSRDGTIQYSNVRMIVFEPTDDVTVYPNPVQSKLMINFPGNWMYKQVQVAIVNEIGQVVFTRQIATALQNETLEIGTLPNGVYTLRLQSSGNITVFKKIQVKK